MSKEDVEAIEKNYHETWGVNRRLMNIILSSSSEELLQRHQEDADAPENLLQSIELIAEYRDHLEAGVKAAKATLARLITMAAYIDNYQNKKNHLQNDTKQQTPSLENSDHCAEPVNASDIADGIIMVDIALEHIRAQRGKKNAAKAGKSRDQGEAVTQALMVSKALMINFHKLAQQEEQRKQESIQDAATETENILQGLRPMYTLKGEHLEEPSGPLEELEAVVSLLLASLDEDTCELRVSPDKLSWSLVLMSDLIDKAKKRAYGYQNHCYDLYRTFESRIKSANLACCTPQSSDTSEH